MNKLDIFKLAQLFNEHKDIKHWKTKDCDDEIKQSKFQFLENIEPFESVISKEEVISKLGRKYKNCLKRMLPLIKKLKLWNHNQIALVQNILAKDYKTNKMIISRIIKDLIDINVIKVVRESNHKEKIARIYVINKKQISIIEEVLKDNNIKINNKKSNDSISYISNTFAEPIKVSQKCNLPLGLTDEAINDGLCKTYPFLSEQQSKADELNKRLPLELQIKFKPNVKRTKTRISKIGLRATNSIVSLKEHENENLDYKGKWRKDYYAEYFGEVPLYRYDFKSSIYRMTYFINTGKFADREYDFYTAIAGKRMTKKQRNDFKYLCMLMYFTKSTNEIIKNNKAIIDKFKLDKEAVKQILEEGIYRMKKTIGESKMSEIFVYESSMYLDIYEYLLKKHNKVCQIYDEFVSDEDIEKDIEEYLRNNIEDIKEKYIRSIKHINDSISYISNTFADNEFELPVIETLEKTDELKDSEKQQIVNDIRTKCLNALKSDVQKYLVSVSTANKISKTLDLRHVFTNKDQKYGFSVTNESVNCYNKWKNIQLELMKIIVNEECII